MFQKKPEGEAEEKKEGEGETEEVTWCPRHSGNYSSHFRRRRPLRARPLQRPHLLRPSQRLLLNELFYDNIFVVVFPKLNIF